MTMKPEKVDSKQINAQGKARLPDPGTVLAFNKEFTTPKFIP